MYIFVSTYVHLSVGANRGQKSWMHLKQEFQVVVSHLTWVLGIKHRSSGGVVHVLNQ